MIQCPSCGKDISDLTFRESKVKFGTLSIMTNGAILKEYDDYYVETETDYSCPLCLTEIADNLQAAKEFLEGK